MSIRMKVVAAAGALALVSMTPGPADAQTARPRGTPYVVGATQSVYNVNCAQGQTQGTAPVRLKIVRRTGRVTRSEWGTTIGSTRRWVATWQGLGSVTMTSQNRFFGATANATFPCPKTDKDIGVFTITVQSFDRRGRPNGTAAHYNVVTRRVGSASGGVAVASGGQSTVLGIQLDAGGPAPVGGVQTGAGGTSQPAGNPLVPLAGLGFAGLAAALLIRRRRCPAV